jgi:hypothetical protein
MFEEIKKFHLNFLVYLFLILDGSILVVVNTFQP